MSDSTNYSGQGSDRERAHQPCTQAEADRQLNESRLEALYRLIHMQDADVDSLVAFALEESARLTQSEIGFVNYLSEDERYVTRAVYTQGTRRRCRMPENVSAFQISGCGLWSEAYRKRAPITVNDYAAPHSGKAGLPAGHLVLRRFISIPVFQAERVAAIVALGNKPTPYDHGDVRQISLLMESLWQIVQRRQAEEKLREREEMYHTIADFTYDWETWVGPDNRYRYISPACLRITGCPAEAFLDDPDLLVQMTHPDDREKVRAHFENEKRQQGFRHLDFRMRTRAGADIWISHMCQPVYDRDGKFLGRRGSNRDITDRKRAEARLVQSQKLEALGTLAGGIAHEFNNILAGMMGYTELARDEAPAGSLFRESMDEILALGSRARDVVRQILAFSRKSVGGRKPHLACQVAEKHLKLILKSVPPGIEVRKTLDEGCGTIVADDDQLQQVFMQLCSNAVRAMESGGGVLSIALSPVVLDSEAVKALEDIRPGQYVRLTVSDTGCGISPEAIEHVFDPFFTTREVGQGSGMGLAVAHGIVAEHGGAIAVESRVGRGTTFSVFLPRAPQETIEEAEEEVAGLPGGTERILLVDDEAALVITTKRILERLGYGVTAMTSSLDALELFRRAPRDYALVLTDLTMPHLSGDRLAAAVTAVRPDIPVILATGYADAVDSERLQQCGVKAFIPKPFRKQDLARTVRMILDGT